MSPALSDRQIARMRFRIALFRRRGLSESEAEKLADRLCDRDADLDGRRMCIECEHLQAPSPEHGRTCFAIRQEARRIADIPAGRARIEALRASWASGAHPNTGVLHLLLQRCLAFSWVKP